MNSFYKEDELKELGLKSFGSNVCISRKVSIYGANQIEIGDNVRIDDFCILSGNIKLQNYIHIAAYCGLFGGDAGIEMRDYTCISSRNVIYAISDDYSGEALTNPTVPDKYRKIISGKVIINKHVLIGTGSTILPGVIIGEGTSVGSMSLINKSIGEWGIYAGIPCHFIRNREKKILELEKDFISSLS